MQFEIQNNESSFHLVLQKFQVINTSYKPCEYNQQLLIYLCMFQYYSICCGEHVAKCPLQSDYS